MSTQRIHLRRVNKIREQGIHDVVKRRERQAKNGKVNEWKKEKERERE